MCAYAQDEQLFLIEQAFMFADMDGNGVVDYKEMCSVLAELGGKFSQNETKQIFQLLDKNGNGTVSFGEFKEAFLKHEGLLDMFVPSPPKLTSEQMSMCKAAFKNVDKDGNGRLDPQELYEVLVSLNCRFPVDKVREVFSALDEDGDGTISFDEFVGGWQSNKGVLKMFVPRRR